MKSLHTERSAELKNWLYAGALIALIALGVCRIVLASQQTSQTIDEAVHVAAGVEWLEHHSYSFHPENPPLARVAVALGPYWHGASAVTEYGDANHTLGSGSDYPMRLQWARAGTLPAFVLLIVLVYGWSRSIFGPASALAAALLLSTLPAVLAHSGLATTDIAAATSTVAAVLALSFWLQKPSLARATLLGCAIGFAGLTKFTALLFLAGSAVPIVAAWIWFSNSSSTRSPKAPLAAQLALAIAVAVAMVWSGYWGSFGPVDLSDASIYQTLDAALPNGGLSHAAAQSLLAARLPAPEFFFGLLEVSLHGLKGHSAYLLGEVSQNGWWYFFPVAIAVKTPLAFLALALWGAVLLCRRARQEGQWVVLVPVIAPLAMLACVLPSNLNIGLRHVLALFPFLSICGGVALAQLLASPRRRSLALALAGAALLLHLGASLGAHPNYIAYFNALASEQPEDFLIDSDLDWGQDLYALRAELESRGIEDASLALFSTADLHNLGLDRFDTLDPGERKRGWIAASLFTIKRQPGYKWLEAYQPEALVGRSIRLYHIDSPSRH